MASIPPFFLDCVVAIGTENSTGVNWVGTGFIVGRHNTDLTDTKHYNTFLVTNKHVLIKYQRVIIRFNSLDGTSTKDYPIDIIENGVMKWTGHPDPNIDVASISINPNFLQNDSAKFDFMKLDEHAMDNAELLNSGVSEGDPIYVLGFPMGIVTPTSNYVITRGGVISRVRDMLAGHSSNYMVDASVFPGNSGGPVTIKPEAMAINDTQAITRSALIGIVRSYVPYQDVAISQQTGNPRVIFEENSGLALVESVDSIKETVDLEFVRATP
jgi:S1-C subfamily serine protease